MRQIKELSPEFWRQFLRIIQAAESPILEKKKSGGDDRTSERPARVK